MGDKFNQIIKPIVNEEKSIYDFVLPDELKIKAKIICIKRKISLAEFCRESIKKNIKTYKQFLLSN